MPDYNIGNDGRFQVSTILKRAKQDMDLRNRQSAVLSHSLHWGENVIRGAFASQNFLSESPMPTQPVSLMTNLLNLATPDFFLFVLSSVVLSRTGRNESTWDLTNRICDRYFSGELWKANHPSSGTARIG